MVKEKNTTDIILDSIADGVFTIDLDWRITSFNRAAEDITGVSKEEAIGRQCCDIFRASICESNCVLRRTFESGKPIINENIYIIDSSGEQVPISVSTALLKNNEGKIIGGVETFRDLSVVEELRRKLEKKYSFQDIVSKNSEMHKIFSILPEISDSDTTVLIEGDSGTGKELIARAIHNLSRRRKKPIVTVNCGALPDNLLESELFGYKAGAFTDAKKDKPGRFAKANGGTIFLDEISDISPALQVRLLRVIQEKEYDPLGSTRPVKADVRIVATTNRNLEKMVRDGEFREDLYFRINIMKIKLPPLRERKEDIPILINHFINHFNNIKRKMISVISQDALAVLMDYDYPGNIRELENIIEHAFVLCRSGIIGIYDLPDHLRPAKDSPPMATLSLNDLEARFITEVLNSCGWNRQMTADRLGIHKTTLWRKMQKLGIRQPGQ